MTLPELRDYQADLVARTSATAAASPADVGILLQSATGSGKTRVGLELALRHLARAQGRRVVWLAGRDELLEQPAAKLRAYGARVAVLRPGEPAPGDAPIIIASIQTVLARGASSLPAHTLTIIDEARHVGGVASARTWAEVAAQVGAGHVRIGLDATPTGDLRGLFSHLLHGPAISTLIREGHLVQPVHFAPAAPADALAAHPLDAYERRVAPERAIVFSRDRAHAHALAAEAAERGIRAAAVDGETPADERRATLDAYERGELDVLTSVNVFVDGYDSPGTGAVIIARGVSSESTWVQMGGRCLRPHPGKTRALVVDLLGHTHRLGLLDEPREWSLDGTPARRTNALPAVVRCSQCLAWAPPSALCPGCGHRTPPPPPPRVKAKDLVEVRQREEEGEQWARLAKFVRQALEKGHSPWAAKHRWEATYGRPVPAGWMQRAIGGAA